MIEEYFSTIVGEFSGLSTGFLGEKVSAID